MWPPNYTEIFAQRQKRLALLRSDPRLLIGAKEYYKTHYVEFIEHWCTTYDPRNARGNVPARLPFIPFRRQRELVEFLLACLDGEQDGLIEKCRDMGATWICAAFSVCLWLFSEGSAVGWGSRKEQLVDKIGDPDSIFEKIRVIIRLLPPEFLPAGFSMKEHATYMRIINPETGSTITGEAGDNIGRGGRKLIYFKDESAHYERPDKIEAALSENTRVQIDISSVNGLGNPFHRKREAGVEWRPGQAVVDGATNVFVMDWSDHPGKTLEWYLKRKKKFEDGGLSHVFAQEVDRNYAASVEGTIIKAEWVEAAIDAHLRPELGITGTGGWVAALDVADDGPDKNAVSARKGIILRNCRDWNDRDPGVTTRNTIGFLADTAGGEDIDFDYDSIGIGVAVKAEINRLVDEGLFPKNVYVSAWNAASGVLEPEEHVIKGDDESPFNKDHFQNLKAQAWWVVRMKFLNTFRAITMGIKFAEEDLISIDSRIEGLQQLKKELCQATMSRSSSTMKMVVNKAPDGTSSPNRADSVVMCYHPVPPEFDAREWIKAYG